MKFFYSILFSLFVSFTYAQVGINTTSPHPSSILDITSTEGGMLTPRMTSLQRLDIATPATGLLVFDTDENSFFYYNGTVWINVGSKLLRENYKLVKTIADLAEESDGSAYNLQTGFLYEINGIIEVDLPINLNGAYIEGVDSNEDILLNNSGAPLFQGSSGGSIRNITLSGNGSDLFNIVGSGSELLLVNNTVLAGSNNVGTLSSLGTVFLSITQFIGNTNGLSISNIDSFLMSNMFWTASNAGTFITASGSFNNFQMANGRIESDSGEVGLDLNSEPSITNEAVLAEISFVGDGTRVIGYSSGSYNGFNFTTDWNVRCAGIPIETDAGATGNFYEDSNLSSGFSQTVSNNNAVEIQGNGSFTSAGLFRYRVSGGGNRLIYEGQSRKNAQVNASLSVRVVGAAGNFYIFVLAKNGVVETETNSVIQIAGDNQIQNVALNGIISLTNEDYIEVFVQRLTGTGTDTLVVFSENLSIR